MYLYVHVCVCVVRGLVGASVLLPRVYVFMYACVVACERGAADVYVLMRRHVRLCV